MSKIEKALNRVREGRGGLQVVPFTGSSPVPLAGTSVVADPGGRPETIANMAKGEVRLLNAGELEQRGIISPQREDTAIQVFRELRTKIIQSTRGKNAVILVTSVRDGCGTSFVARNLAAAFAFDMRKTALLIDCNLNNPSVHKLLAKPGALGLLDYFENPNLDVREIIHPVGIARCRLITTGARRDVHDEHFTSEKMRHLIETLRRRYNERFIVIDGPPMSQLADIRVLAELADYAVIVARYASTTNAQIDACIDAVGEKKVVSVVFNDEPRVPRLT